VERPYSYDGSTRAWLPSQSKVMMPFYYVITKILMLKELTN